MIYISVTAFFLSVCTSVVTLQPFSNCSETMEAVLVPQSKCTLRKTKGIVYCKYRDRPFLTQFSHSAQLTYVDEVVDPGNSSIVTFCLGLRWQFWQSHTTAVQMNFNQNIIVGVLQMNKSCRTSAEKCSWFSVQLRVELMDLPIMSLAPDFDSFWNFSSPLLAPPYDWFVRFIMKEYTGKATPEAAVVAMRGTSVRSIVLRGKTWDHTKRTLPIFINMTALQDLSLSIYYELHPVCFRNTPNLMNISLNEGRLKSPPPCLQELKKLNTLILINNRINDVLSVFELRLHVRELSLNYNEIESLPTSFPTSPKLLVLRLDYCGLVTLYPNTFRGLINLEVLSLKGNYFINISPSSFADMPRLRDLWLSDCSLHEWPVEALGDLTLRVLRLNKNLLKGIPNLSEIGTTVELLDISGNEIQSWDDRDVFSYYKGYLNYATQRNMDKEGNKTFISKTWILDLKIQNNLIQTLTEPMRTSLGNLRKVYMSANKIDCADCNTPLLQDWLRTTKVHMEEILVCSDPPLDKDKRVSEITYDANMCLGPYRKIVAVAAPVCVVVGVVLITILALYIYRTEVAYLRHLIHIRHAKKLNKQESNECIYDAFVCYSGRDRKWVLQCFAPLLERPPHRYRLCLFDRDFRLGTHIVTNIADAIDRSAKVVVVLTEHFIASKWCAWELEMANHKLFSEDRTFLVLLELEPLPRDRLPRLLRFLQDTRPLVRWRRRATSMEAEMAAKELRRALGSSLHQRNATVRENDSDENTPLIGAEN